MNSQKLVRIISTLVALILLATSANAQFRRRKPRIRPQFRKYQPTTTLNIQIGSDFEHDQFLAGAGLGIPLGIFWKLSPGFQYYFTDGMNRWQFDGDLVFKPRPQGVFYFGGGVAMDYVIPETGDKTSKVGGNAFVGLDFSGHRMRSMAPFIKARWTFYEDDTFFSLLGGLSLALR